MPRPDTSARAIEQRHPFAAPDAAPLRRHDVRMDKERRASEQPPAHALGRALDYALALLAVVASVGAAHVLQPMVPLANLFLVFLAGVLLVAVRTAPVPAIVTALMSALAYNFFFTEPRYTLYIHRTDDLLTVVLFLAVGLIAGQLAGRLRQQMQMLSDSHEQTQTLAELNRCLAAGADPAAMAIDTVHIVARRLQMPTVILWPGAQGLECVATSEDGLSLDASAWTAAREAVGKRRPSGFLADAATASRWHFLPLTTERDVFGAMGVRFDDGIPVAARSALEVIAGNIALALARAHLAVSLKRAELAEETERLRSALLSSVSHDLKTPLASMIGAASTLRDLGDDLSTADRGELAEAIVSEGGRLDRYIRNLLDMTRLGQGTLGIARDWIGLDEIVNAALRRTAEMLGKLQGGARDRAGSAAAARAPGADRAGTRECDRERSTILTRRR